MSNRKSNTLSKQAGSRSVFWDQMRGNGQSSFGEHIPQLKLHPQELRNLSDGIKNWFLENKPELIDTGILGGLETVEKSRVPSGKPKK